MLRSGLQKLWFGLPRLKEVSFACLWLLALGVLPVKASALDIRVRLFSHTEIKHLRLGNHFGSFSLLAANPEGEVIDTVFDLYDATQQAALEIAVGPYGLELRSGEQLIGRFHRLLLLPAFDTAVFQVRASGQHRIYRGRLDIWPRDEQLFVVNEVEIEEYVAGVVESEGGHIPSYEYFKAQAILARTFAIRNWRKHGAQGYNLKDDVSSQVYHHMAYLQNAPNIRTAVAQTLDTIVVDADCTPIQALFHANSGGETAPSEDAWQTKISYLRGKQDPFSLKGPSARWEKRIGQKQMLDYLRRAFGSEVSDMVLKKALLNLPAHSRVGTLIVADKKLKMREIRNAFQLRSAFFSVEESGEEFILKGRGFGHGVGLAQDGAMEMAKQGYCYQDILYFYYTGIELDQLSAYLDQL